jgi:hypothetical protein
MKTILILAVALATLTAGIVVAATAIEAPGEAITVTNYGKKAAVTFDHALHTAQGTECVSCHHTIAAVPDSAAPDSAANDAVQYKCGECHKGGAEGETPKIKDALHGIDKGVCYSCHLQKKAANKLKCASCHKG